MIPLSLDEIAAVVGGSTGAAGRVIVSAPAVLDGRKAEPGGLLNANPDSTRAALDALAAVQARRRIAVLGEMRELGAHSPAEHRAVGRYAAARADLVLAIGSGAQPIADAAGERALALPDNAAAIAWLREHVGEGDVVLVKASRGERLDEVAAALA